MDFKKPPNYGYHLHATLAEQSTYRLFPVSSSSAEYSVISSLFNGVADVKSVEQIMNPSLWDRFKMTRKEMLKSKTTDAKLLADFGLSETEIAEAMAYSKNFKQNIQVAHVPYDLNMALLFHCTRNRNNVEAILSQGLDERLGNVGGLLGRGIYFADNPMKSMSYDGCNVIFLFAVLLGDCLCMDDKTDRFVREPKKRDDQKRHLNDLAFDSIAGKPDGYNSEFVIYNRYQCLPLYKVEYNKLVYGSNGTGKIDFPELCWKANDQNENPLPSPIRLRTENWPFYAEKLFAQMY